jgi:hypothetical protein
MAMTLNLGKARWAAQRAEAIERQIMDMTPPGGADWRTRRRHAEAVACLHREAVRLRRVNGYRPSLIARLEGRA